MTNFIKFLNIRHLMIVLCLLIFFQKTNAAIVFEVKTVSDSLCEKTDSVENASTMKLTWWNNWGRITSGIIGCGGWGFLAGAWFGSVVPGIGTAAGGIVGTIGGCYIGYKWSTKINNKRKKELAFRNSKR